MARTYNNLDSARNYIRYVESEDGKTERDAIAQAVFPYLPADKHSYILDAACGTGWLAGLMAKKYEKILGFDLSKPLLNYARQNAAPNCIFSEADIFKNIPRLDKPYSCAIACLAIHDVSNPKNAYIRLHEVLEDGGKLIVVAANPYYSYPVGVWKRGIFGKIFRKGKTSLRLRPYNNFARLSREFYWKKNIPSYFQTLPETLNSALESGFALEKVEEIKINDSKRLTGRKWQLYNFPMLLMFIFKKLP